ncbi:MarR family transcriptional regulator [Burkholderia sp. Leaf177]|uniref:MarR family winged helix-turn-helix transcriptional regulator n=1 Tax=Burkholderia sp. Leaf177 TaxID=1736287 RepID=UPI0006FB7261|nr:MarR family winged helix-turn-helix transcriptional regulator [Burkholderia sp. Leaf177]KQR76572.1 MarR family transcriptional regulator [Burkholderia sp. Leaf177]
MTSPDSTYLDCNCFAIRQAARFVSQLYERHVSQAGVTAAQFTLLAAIQRRPGTTMAELADAMVMERTTLVRALKPLQRDGLVTAEQQDAGTRAVALNLSEAGGKMLGEAALRWKDAQKEFEQKFGQERAGELRKTLLDLTSME